MGAPLTRPARPPMQRREFLQTSAAGLAATLATGHGCSTIAAAADDKEAPRTFATPKEAINSPRETLAYIPCIRAGTPINKPDYLATIDLAPTSKTYGQVIHRLTMPNV